ncbi:YbaB/EbfC family nucleoid-associated protein [Kibdelosporangium lantanae]
MADPNAELAAIESMVADWEHTGQERLARVKEVTDRIATLTATETSPEVSVTVDAKGLPTDITLTEESRKRPAGEVSAAIMATLRKAQARIPAMMSAAADDLGLGGDSVVAHMLDQAEQSFPSPVEPDRGRPRRSEEDEDFSDRDPLSEKW